MRVAVLLSILASASAFGASSSTFGVKSITSTTLNAVPEGASAAILERQAKADRWFEIRTLSKEEAEAQLSGEELEAHKRYYAELDEDMAKLQDIAKLMLKSLEPPTVKPKGKKQRKRDRWAKVQQREAAKAAALVTKSK
mmetsp:Transcript_11249/g.21042  ORF Transcript_11249/g.21042 Transcript_11249/m.21042 type:complete len:140 (+) Transcript_11249:131-550(+)